MSTIALDALALLWVAASLPAFAHAFRVPLDIAGLLFTANAIGFVIAAPLCGILGDMWGKRTVAAAACALLAAGLGALAVSRAFAAAMAAVVLVGAGAGSVETGTTALLPDLYPGNEGYGANFSQVFFGVGAMVAPLVLLAPAVGWRARFALCALGCVMAAAGFASQRRGDAPHGGRGVGAWLARVLEIARQPGVAWPVIAMILYTGVEVSVWGWLYAVVTGPGGAGPRWAVADLAGFWLAMGLGRYAAGVLSRRVPLPALIAASAAAGVPSLLLTLLLRGHALGWAAVFVCGLSFAGVWPSLVALAHQRHGGSSFLTSLMVGAGGAGGLVVPAAFGFGVARLGLRTSAVLLAATLAPVGLLPHVRAAAAGTATE